MISVKDVIKKLSPRQKSMLLKQWSLYVNDIAPGYTVTQQSIYTQLFWLTVVTGNKICQISYPHLGKLCHIKTMRVIGRTVKELEKKRHLKILKQGFKISSIYRIYSPLEILTPDKHDKKSKKKSK